MAKTGLSVIKGVSNGLTPVNAPDKNTVGILFQRERGVPNKVRRYSTLEEDEQYFGGIVSGLYGREIVKSLLTNAGQAGSEIYAARIVAADSVTATANITIPSLGVDVVLNAAQLGEDDPGTWANGLIAEIIIANTLSSNATPYRYRLKNSSGDVLESYAAGTWASLKSWLTNQSSYVRLATVTGDASGTNVGTVALDAYGAANISYTSRTKTLLIPFDGSSETVATVFDKIMVGDKLYQDTGGGASEIGVVSEITAIFSNGTTVYGSYRFDTIVNAPTNSTNASTISVAGPVSGSATFANGANGSITEQDYYPVESGGNAYGFAVFSPYDLKVIFQCDYFTTTMAINGKNYAENNNTFYVQTTAYNASETSLEAFKTLLRNNLSSGCAIYAYWAKMLNDSTGEQMWYPAYGQIIGGGYMRVPFLAGDFIHIPPAGINSAASDVFEAWPAALTQSKIDKYVQEWGINVPVTKQNLGTYLASSRTTSSNSLYHSIHTALQANYYATVLEDNMQWTTQVPKTPELTRQIVSYLNSFFGIEYDNGALERSVSYDEALEIVPDTTSGDRKILTIEIRYIPTECTESVVLKLNRNDGNLTVTT